jgi:AcrR family transcriptional regulator
VAAGPTQHRADFARNERRILDAAARVLSERPSAGMAGIASEAGVGRATLYRHFATRDELIDALESELLDAAAAIIAQQSARTDVGAAEALGRSESTRAAASRMRRSLRAKSARCEVGPAATAQACHVDRPLAFSERPPQRPTRARPRARRRRTPRGPARR